MLRVPIRDLSSPREVKPRVFDALICEDKILLDVKDSTACPMRTRLICLHCRAANPRMWPSTPAFGH